MNCSEPGWYRVHLIKEEMSMWGEMHSNPIQCKTVYETYTTVDYDKLINFITDRKIR